MPWARFDPDRDLLPDRAHAWITLHVDGYQPATFGIDLRLAANIAAIARTSRETVGHDVVVSQLVITPYPTRLTSSNRSTAHGSTRPFLRTTTNGSQGTSGQAAALGDLGSDVAWSGPHSITSNSRAAATDITCRATGK